MKSSFSYLTLCSILLTTLIGCQDDSLSQESSNTQTAHNISTANLGTVQGELRLPTDQECSLFTAYQVGRPNSLFEIDIEQSQVRNHRYSFLQELPQGDYQLKGVLSCDKEGEALEYESLHDDVSIQPGLRSSVQFRFFFDIQNDLSQVDLSFCAELALRSLSPLGEACQGEEMRAQYQVEWLRQDCGSIFLQMSINDEVMAESRMFSFPMEEVNLVGFAPESLGSYLVKISLSSPEGGMIELYQSVVEVVSCHDEIDDEGQEDKEIICDSEESLNGLLDLDYIHNEVANLTYLLREVLVTSASETLSDEDRDMLKNEMMITVAEMSSMAAILNLDTDIDMMALQCNFSDLNGLCPDADRYFENEMPSLAHTVAQVSALNFDELDLEEAITTIDEAILSISKARSHIGAMYVRFSTIMGHVETEDDLYAIASDIMNRNVELAIMSANDVSSSEDREMINIFFVQLRDEFTRLNSCYSCEIEVDETLISDCETNECLSVDTQENALFALTETETLLENLNQCLEP